MAIAARQASYCKDLVSVIIPAFYSGPSLYEAAESVLNQTYRPLQLIICDDGTENFSIDTFKSELDKPPADILFTVIHHPQNLGTVKNLRSGLELANGEWVIFLAADDRLFCADTVTHLVTQAQKYEVDWIVAKTSADAGAAPSTFPDHYISELLFAGDTAKLYEQLSFQCCLPSSGNLYHRAIIDTIGGLDCRVRLVEDWPLFLNLTRSGIMPQESEEISVLRGNSGISHHHAGRNYVYQKDLILIMNEMILPQVDSLSPPIRKKLIRQIQDKNAIFQLRFSCKTPWQRIFWLSTHIGTIFRKALQRR